MIDILLGLTFGWLLVLTWKLWGYRTAILQLQRDVWETGGVVDELTTAKTLKAAPREVR